MSSNDEYSDQDGTGSRLRHLAIVGSGSGLGGGTVEREQMILPGLDVNPIERTVTDGDGVQRTETTDTLVTLGQSFRTCNTCYVAANCPAFKPNHTCAFNIPVEARTKDQVQAIMRSVVEMQMQRVAFARFGEQVEGQGVDGALSGEIDRLFSILGKMKDIMDDKDVFRLEMEARGNSGVLSRLFGEGVGVAARALPIPVSSDEVMHRFDP